MAPGSRPARWGFLCPPAYRVPHAAHRPCLHLVLQEERPSLFTWLPQHLRQAPGASRLPTSHSSVLVVPLLLLLVSPSGEPTFREERAARGRCPLQPEAGAEPQTPACVTNESL